MPWNKKDKCLRIHEKDYALGGNMARDLLSSGKDTKSRQCVIIRDETQPQVVRCTKCATVISLHCTYMCCSMLKLLQADCCSSRNLFKRQCINRSEGKRPIKMQYAFCFFRFCRTYNRFSMSHLRHLKHYLVKLIIKQGTPTTFLPKGKLYKRHIFLFYDRFYMRSII